MYGAIYGDIAGSFYKNKFCRDIDIYHGKGNITDETVMLASVCDYLNSGIKQDQDIFSGAECAVGYAKTYRKFIYKYINAGFDQSMISWARNMKLKKQNAQSSICVARVAPIAYAYDSLADIEFQVRLSCFYTHNHKSSTLAAEVTAGSIYLALCGASKIKIMQYAENKLKTSLQIPFESLKKNTVTDARVQYTVPNAFMAFFNSESYEETIYNSLILGGDCDTVASISGALAEAFYGGVEPKVAEHFAKFIPSELSEIFEKFHVTYVDFNKNRIEEM